MLHRNRELYNLSEILKHEERKVFEIPSELPKSMDREDARLCWTAWCKKFLRTHEYSKGWQKAKNL